MRATHLLIALPLFATAAFIAPPASARLLPPIEIAQASADETSARIAYFNRLDAFQNCSATERVVQSHIYTPDAKPARGSACTYPGPYVSPSVAAAERRADSATAQASTGRSEIRIAQAGR